MIENKNREYAICILSVYLYHKGVALGVHAADRGAAADEQNHVVIRRGHAVGRVDGADVDLAVVAGVDRGIGDLIIQVRPEHCLHAVVILDKPHLVAVDKHRVIHAQPVYAPQYRVGQRRAVALRRAETERIVTLHQRQLRRVGQQLAGRLIRRTLTDIGAGGGVEALGGEIHRNMKVAAMKLKDGKLVSVTAVSEGKEVTFQADYVLSSMPVKDLIESIGQNVVPPDVYRNAAELPYRDFIAVGLETDRLKLKNRTGLQTINDIVPDCWIYIQEPDVRIGRLQIFNNWSPYMLKDPLHKVWLGLEYFCSEGDELWQMDDRQFIDFAAGELEKIGVIDASSVTSSVRIKVRKAYPAYFGSYENFGVIRNWLDTVGNLYCIGRNGQHRYNNMDHSMLSAMSAVRLIISGNQDRSQLWNINAEAEYHEEKSR